jgi:UDP-N-acetylglucosamine/UDP-N-acetylgalactosamine 4-epimerase
MNISITGGLGFIGSALGSALSGAGHGVRLVDICDHGPVSGNDYLQGSVLDADDCHAACEGMNVVVHCAAMHEASAIAKDPLSSIELNVTGTLNLLHAAIATGVKRFVFLSSAKVFGEPATLPSVESDVAIPQNTYGLSKLASEYHCHTLQAQANIQIVIVRPFSVYGPAQELDSGYVGMILSSLLGNTELNLPGRPDFIRDFVYIDDVIRLCSAVVTADLPGITIFNAGSGKQTSLRELLVLAAKISGVDLDGHYRVPGAGTLLRMQACMKHAEAKLGYRPKYDLGEGLAETIDWFLRNRLVAGKVAGK